MTNKSRGWDRETRTQVIAKNRNLETSGNAVLQVQNFAGNEFENQAIIGWVKQGNERQVEAESDDESRQRVMGNVVLVGKWQ